MGIYACFSGDGIHMYLHIPIPDMPVIYVHMFARKHENEYF